MFGENTKKTYRLGDRVRVQIVRVDMERRQIDLGLEDVLEKVRQNERSRGPQRSSSRPKKEQRKGTPEERRKRKQRREDKQRPRRRMSAQAAEIE